MDFAWFPTFVLASVLVATSAKSVAANKQGLELSFDRQLNFDSTYVVCGQLTCRAKGNSLTIDSVTISELNSSNSSRRLLALTPTYPDPQISKHDIIGNGTLENNQASISLDLYATTICEYGYFICEVVYTKPSGETGKQLAAVGEDQLAILDLQSTQPVSEAKLLHNDSPNPYTSPFWYLKDELNERKFESLERRLDGLSFTGDSRKDSNLETRVESLEARLNHGPGASDAVGFLPSTKEDTLSARVSVLENKFLSVFPHHSLLPGTNGQTLDGPEGAQSDSSTNKQPVTCEPGMGDDVITWYPEYIVLNHSAIGKQILCDTETDGGGWIVIQRRMKGDVDFYRRWAAYRDGFGSVTGDFWLGNEAIHALTVASSYELRIDFRIGGQKKFAQYSSFRIENEADKYRLRIGSYTGTIGQSSGKGLSYVCDKPFTTFDRDNDDHASNCAVLDHGAWWYRACHYSNLNGVWGEKSADGISWYTGGSWLYPTTVEMKIRRVVSPING